MLSLRVYVGFGTCGVGVRRVWFPNFGVSTTAPFLLQFYITHSGTVYDIVTWFGNVVRVWNCTF